MGQRCLRALGCDTYLLAADHDDVGDNEFAAVVFLPLTTHTTVEPLRVDTCAVERRCADASRRTSEGHGWTQLVAGIYEFRDGRIIRAEGRQDPFALYREVGLPIPDLWAGEPVGADHVPA